MSWFSYGATGGQRTPELSPGPDNAVAWPGGHQREDRGAIPLIAHLVWPDRQEWRAVTARNWTRELVLVTWPPTATERGGACWLRVEDVTRVVVR